MRKINLFKLNYGPEEIEAVKSVIESQWITMGPKTLQFEKEFSQFIGTKYGVALNSCTAALHLALRILDIGPGDEVILPSLTFVATANAVLYVGATPVFADIKDVDHWTISSKDIERKITPNTRAIIVMHYAGFGCDMSDILDIAKKNNLKVIEDACHAPGGILSGEKLGTLGDMSCFSFYSNKNIATGEGGMLLVNNKDYFEKAKLLRSHGMTSGAHERSQGAKFYDVVSLGYNYRIDDIRSALGLVQLKKLPEDIKARNESAEQYRKNLDSINWINVPFDNYDGLSTYYIFPILLKNGKREEVRHKLEKVGIQTSMHYPPVHLFKHYSPYRSSLPITERIGECALTLPMYSNFEKEDLDYICENLQSFKFQISQLQ